MSSNSSGRGLFFRIFESSTFESIASIRLAMERAGISSEKKATFLSLLIMLYIMLRANAVLPILGRAAMITYS